MGKAKIKKMNLRLVYYLLFYKLYKLASWTRSNEEASLVSSFLVGFLIIQWSIYILAALNVKDFFPKYFFWVGFLLSIILNVFVILRNRKYEKIIAEIETKKVHVFFHIMVFLLLSWTFIGIYFL